MPIAQNSTVGMTNTQEPRFIGAITPTKLQAITIHQIKDSAMVQFAAMEHVAPLRVAEPAHIMAAFGPG